VRSAGGWAAVQTLRKSREAFASDERILGSSDFVASVLKQAHEDYEKKTAAGIRGLDLERLETVVCNNFGLTPAMLKSPSKQSRIARERKMMRPQPADSMWGR